MENKSVVFVLVSTASDSPTLLGACHDPEPLKQRKAQIIEDRVEKFGMFSNAESHMQRVEENAYRRGLDLVILEVPYYV